jgi:hypothetical protein
MALALSWTACGGSSSGPSVPRTSDLDAAEAPPPWSDLALPDLVPETAPAPASGGGWLDVDGRFRCVQVYTVEPEEDEPGCLADGFSVATTVAFTFEPQAMVATMALVEPLRIAEVRHCGERTRPVARPRARTLHSVAPDLAEAPAAAEDASAPGLPPCADDRLVFHFAPNVRHELQGTIHGFAADGGIGAVVLRRGDTDLAQWTVGPGEIPDACNAGATVETEWFLDVEIVCEGDTAVVTADTWRRYENPPCYERGVFPAVDAPDVPCDPAILPPEGFVRGEFLRLRVDLADGSATPLTVATPRFDPTPED